MREEGLIAATTSALPRRRGRERLVARTCRSSVAAWLLVLNGAHATTETAPTHPLEASADGVFLAHTATGYIHRFAIANGTLVEQAKRHICEEPGAVRAHGRSVFVVCPAARALIELDAKSLGTKRTLALPAEPADLVFAGKRAFVALPRTRALIVLDPKNGKTIATMALAMSEPRALATDGEKVYVLGYRTGNGTTVLPGAVIDRQQIAAQFNAASHPDSPAQGRNPVPNLPEGFVPAKNVALPRAPQSGLIVRQQDDGVWRDDAGRDWSEFVSGERAPLAGRKPGWALPDNDLAIVSSKLRLTYRSSLLTHGLAIASIDGDVAIAAIEAHNQIRFEPNLRGRFVRHELLIGRPEDLSRTAAHDLNPHIDVQGQGSPNTSIAEVRAIVADKHHFYLAAAGSDRIVIMNRRARSIAQLPVPAAPIALALYEGQLLLFSRDTAQLSAIDLDRRAMTQTIDIRPAPDARLALGRRWLTNARLTSANGTQSCAGCHLDGHVDRLAWDLGDPAGEMKPFAGNCFTDAGRRCTDWHPMKGPMVTQSLRDIIGREPFHWRGDRIGIHDFKQTYTKLLGRSAAPSDADLDQLKAYLSQLKSPRNPFLTSAGKLPTRLDLNAIAGIGAPRRSSWPIGNAARGLVRFRSEKLAAPFACVHCHALPHGLAPTDRGMAGGSALPDGPNGEAHHGLSSLTGLGQTFKVPALVGLHDKINPYVGIGFGHDGTQLTLADFVRTRNLSISDEQAEADILALLVAFEPGAAGR